MGRLRRHRLDHEYPLGLHRDFNSTSGQRPAETFSLHHVLVPPVTFHSQMLSSASAIEFPQTPSFFFLVKASTTTHRSRSDLVRRGHQLPAALRVVCTGSPDTPLTSIQVDVITVIRILSWTPSVRVARS